MVNLRLITMGRAGGRAGSILAGMTVSVMLLGHAAAVSAQDRCWTMGGSTGTVDEADLNLVTLTDNTAAVSGAVTNATADIRYADIRYNVVPVDGVFGGEQNAKMLTVRFADNGVAVQVIVRLRRVNIFTDVCQGSEFDFENNIPAPHIIPLDVFVLKTYLPLKDRELSVLRQVLRSASQPFGPAKITRVSPPGEAPKSGASAIRENCRGIAPLT